jgi:hypothetical protein
VGLKGSKSGRDREGLKVKGEKMGGARSRHGKKWEIEKIETQIFAI